jgi:hypothetical protein
MLDLRALKFVDGGSVYYISRRNSGRHALKIVYESGYEPIVHAVTVPEWNEWKQLLPVMNERLAVTVDRVFGLNLEVDLKNILGMWNKMEIVMNRETVLRRQPLDVVHVEEIEVGPSLLVKDIKGDSILVEHELLLSGFVDDSAGFVKVIDKYHTWLNKDYTVIESSWYGSTTDLIRLSEPRESRVRVGLFKEAGCGEECYLTFLFNYGDSISVESMVDGADNSSFLYVGADGAGDFTNPNYVNRKFVVTSRKEAIFRSYYGPDALPEWVDSCIDIRLVED